MKENGNLAEKMVVLFVLILCYLFDDVKLLIGHGKFSMRDGSIYEGDFVNDEILGVGCYYNARTGDQYEGDFVMGEKSGKGVMKYIDGSIYEGEWDSNKRQGELYISLEARWHV